MCRGAGLAEHDRAGRVDRGDRPSDLWWLRQRHVVRSDADILRNLRLTNWIAAPIGAGFTAWSFALYPYGDPFAKSQVAFYMAVTVIGCIFSLMHLRSAALIVTLVVDVPYVLFFWAHRRTDAEGDRGQQSSRLRRDGDGAVHLLS